ncbi:calcium-dependent phosphotriesterase [Zopfia rhizophila CBS 207.26]|uniref:Calcium-dependent phosphotriesterase n=1 Tax=Zopfia rhizophila CBS 207.26 TaxID=1314779 RepID=A0A6A6EQV9_9PEZI|nr:calcium-dependent phosphotriesterase [Zopfia rhizophila CBS 207.26]
MISTPCLLFVLTSTVSGFLKELPAEFAEGPATWAWVSYDSPSVAVLPGSFNRSVFDAPHESNVSDPVIASVNAYLNSTNFIAYDSRFLEILGPNATVTHIQHLAYQSHEAPCYNPKAGELFFVEWGPPGGENGTHNWQYLLHTRNNTLKKIVTKPPTSNVHGCVVYRDTMYVVTDGSHKETGALVTIDPKTFKRTVMLNNYYQQPFMGFNDLDIDPDGNIWLTDSKSAYGRDLTAFTNPTNPTVYMVNGTTMRPKVVHTTTGNANGITVSRDSSGNHILFLPDTGRRCFNNARLLNNPISYFYDGIRASRNGYLFAGAGDGVDVIDSRDGMTLGTIRVGGGENLAVSVAFGVHELWIVGRGGVWHVDGVKERLDREW